MIVSPKAEDDIADIERWYDQQGPGLGFGFIASLDRAFARIERTPESCACALQDVRIASTPRFPYVVYFRVIETEVVVIGVFHNRRGPRADRSRI